MKKLEIEVTYKYEIEVDENSPVVKEYESEKELVSDLVHYRFMILPVLKNGVTVNDVEVLQFDY